ncbi:IS1182 family transposase ISMac2 [Spirochaetia bacterium]|nr:IS1182 family transposase ISMac2 [Spirochaetia bacterium]
MGIRFVEIDRETPMLIPVDLREWIPENHLVHFIIEAVEGLEIGSFKVNERGSGDEQYPPEMMLALLIYCYATKRMSSRVIEEATHTDIAVRYICGGKAHPDHTVICRFRSGNKAAFKEAFTKVLILAKEMGHLKRVGAISVDGTKIHANASKHAAMSYQRAGELIAETEQEVAELIKKAEEADAKPLEAGLTIPEEIARRDIRKGELQRAREIMEARYAEAKGESGKEGEKEPANEGKGPDGGGKGKSKKPLEEYQYNFTDEDSRIMKAGNGKHFEQSYNAQAAVDISSMLVLGNYVTNHVNDAKELPSVVDRVDQSVYEVETVIADAGFFSEAAITAIEQEDEKGTRQGPLVYCSVGRQKHHRSVQDLEQHKEPAPVAPDATMTEKMTQRLKTKAGKEYYKKRKETVEPVFGIIKQAMGFRQFLLRGLEKVNIEWDLVTLAYDFRRLFALSQG